MLISFLAGVPLSIGVLIASIAGRRRMAGAAGATLLTMFSIALFVFTAGVFLREGAICMVMAAPIFIGMGIIGAIIGALASKSKGAASRLLPAIVLLPVG